MSTKFRTFYGVLGEARKGLTFKDASRTRQEFLKESLTSTIIDRFASTGVLCPTVNQERIAQFGDFSSLPGDLLEAHSRMVEVRKLFEDLPASTREFFANSPLAFVQFMSDEGNRSKAVELGLIAKPVEPVQPVEPAPVDSQPKSE